MTASDRSTVQDAFERSYVRAQYIWVQMLTEHLTDCSRTFKGDLQSMLIVAIIGQMLLAEMIRSGLGDDPGNTLIEMPKGQTAINASSLSDVLGIPRETVRRKLEDLAARGWIERHNGGWQIRATDATTVARRDLQELDARGIARVAKLVADFNDLARRLGRDSEGQG